MADQPIESIESPTRQSKDIVSGARDEINAVTRNAADASWKNDVKQQTTVCEANGVLPAVKLVAEHPQEALKEEHGQSDKTTLKAGVNQQKFELGASGEEMAWHDWQERMNHNIFEKMQSQLAVHHLPNGLECKINYTVDKNGGFGWKMTESSGNAEYDKLIAKSIDETLRYHPELLKFPQGTHKSTYSREATFNTGGSHYGGYSTGATETEQYKY